ncbi:MAG: S8 family serine peptidase, partial [Candidatus Eisenbacteria bacterium]
AVSVFANDQQAAMIASLPFVRETRLVARGSKPMPDIVPADGSHSSVPDGRALDYGEAQGQIEQIQVDQLHDEGLDGTGVLIAMLDTGFDTDHQAYRHLDIVAERDFINDDTETADQPGDPEGQDGHGTATLSCVGGNTRASSTEVRSRPGSSSARPRSSTRRSRQRRTTGRRPSSGPTVSARTWSRVPWDISTGTPTRTWTATPP